MEINRSELSQKFIDLFVGTLKFTEEEFELMLSHFKLELIPRSFFYLKAGNTSKQKAYINKGSTRTFTVDAKARQHIFQRIPLQYIASYLDIEPPSLSRLRSRLSKK